MIYVIIQKNWLKTFSYKLNFCFKQGETKSAKKLVFWLYFYIYIYNLIASKHIEVNISKVTSTIWMH